MASTRSRGALSRRRSGRLRRAGPSWPRLIVAVSCVAALLGALGLAALWAAWPREATPGEQELPAAATTLSPQAGTLPAQEGPALGEVAADGSLVADPERLVAEGLASVEERDVPQDLAEASAAVLEGYRAEGAVPVRAGYLDLLGRTWACVVQGPGWAEVCVVSQAEGQQGSHVQVTRMEEHRWREAHG